MKSEGTAPYETRLRFFLPSEALTPFISTYYYMEVASASGEVVQDYLHPEWANIRIAHDSDLEAQIGNGQSKRAPESLVVGPTSFATRFALTRGKFWGIGLLPLGWARFIARPANEYADQVHDMLEGEEFSPFQDLTGMLHRSGASLAQQAAIIDSHLLDRIGPEHHDDADIGRALEALNDTTCSTVAAMSERSGVKVRTLERLSRRAFGFTPKLLLRRQRFLRSLAQFMLDPKLSWLNTLDFHYHDQAHFVRDFKRFMTMTPNQYRNMAHPILMAAARARMEIAGQAVQGLHGSSE